MDLPGTPQFNVLKMASQIRKQAIRKKEEVKSGIEYHTSQIVFFFFFLPAGSVKYCDS